MHTVLRGAPQELAFILSICTLRTLAAALAMNQLTGKMPLIRQRC